MIILYQTNGDRGLNEAIRCLSRFYPISKTVLIGDRQYVKTGRFYNISHIDTSLVDRIYKHATDNLPQYEKECIRRWIAGRDVMKDLGVDRAFFMDSDVLLCCNPFDAPHCRDCDMTLGSEGGLDSYESDLQSSWSILSAGVSMQSSKSIGVFCEFMKEYFANDTQKHYGSSDMGVWTALARRGDLKWRQTNKVIDGSIFDPNLGHSSPLYMDGPADVQGRYTKIVHIHNGMPYTVMRDGRLVRMNCVHFWACLKERMKHFNDMMEASLTWKGFQG